jgi:hypothetical protein
MTGRVRDEQEIARLYLQRLNNLNDEQRANLLVRIASVKEQLISLTPETLLSLATTIGKNLPHHLENIEIKDTLRPLGTEQHERDVRRARMDAAGSHAPREYPSTTPEQRAATTHQQSSQEGPDYFAKHKSRADLAQPKSQRLGKYQDLEKFTRNRSDNDHQDARVGQEQRDANDKRQTPPVERHRQIERAAKDPDYRLTASELTSSEKQRERFTPRGQDRSPNVRSHAQDHERGGRGSRSR